MDKVFRLTYRDWITAVAARRADMARTIATHRSEVLDVLVAIKSFAARIFSFVVFHSLPFPFLYTRQDSEEDHALGCLFFRLP